MKNIQSEIIENSPISNDFYFLKVKSPGMKEPQPGQFMTIRIDDNSAPLLRRPFAYSGYDKESGCIELIYQKRGAATESLSRKAAGDEVSILGPLGNCFPEPGISRGLEEATGAILVAGGVGLGPVLFLANHLKAKGIPFTMVSGFRSADFVPGEKQLGDHTIVCTDDGSAGFSGNVVQYLDTLPSSETDGRIVVSCGPLPMMRALNKWAETRSLTSYVSMEEMMGCGVGACMGCIVDTTDERGYARVCVEGPVFESGMIKWS